MGASGTGAVGTSGTAAVGEARPAFDAVALRCFHKHFAPFAQDLQVALSPWPPRAPRRASVSLATPQPPSTTMGMGLQPVHAAALHVPMHPQHDPFATIGEVLRVLCAFLAEQRMLACFQVGVFSTW